MGAFDQHGNRANVTLNLHQVQAGQLVVLGRLVKRRLHKLPRRAIFPDGGTNPRSYDASPSNISDSLHHSISDSPHHSLVSDHADSQTWLLACGMGLSTALVLVAFHALRRPVEENLPRPLPSRPARTPYIDPGVVQPESYTVEASDTCEEEEPLEERGATPL